MILALLLESAARSLALGVAVWLGLKVARVRSAHVQMASWTMVLAAAIGMPALMRLATVPIPAPGLPSAGVLPPVFLADPLAQSRLQVAQIQGAGAPVFVAWRTCLTFGLVGGALLLLCRLLTGLVLTWRLWRSARAISEPWAKAADIRVSESIKLPVTFASTILLPPESLSWSPPLRDAVLAHERSHVDHCDFYVQLAAGLHRAVFWFSPLAWSLQKQLVELAETRSDEAALAALGDRASYAQFLLDLADRRQHIPAAVAMARPSTVARRVERILGGTPFSEKLNWKKRTLLAVGLGPAVVLAAGCSMQVRAQKTASPQPAQPAAASSSNTGNQRPNPGIAASPSTSTGVNAATVLDAGASEESYAIVTDGTISSQIGPGAHTRWHDLPARLQALRSEVRGDFIWFERDLKSYYITDPTFLKRAKDLVAPQEQLARMQDDLGRQQARLGAMQTDLGAQQSRVVVKAPDLTRQMDELRAHLDLLREFGRSSGKELQQDKLGALQAQVGALQALTGELQAQAGQEQSRLSAEQARLGVEQEKLGEQQGKLGEQQAELAEHIDQQMRILINEAFRLGLAQRAE